MKIKEIPISEITPYANNPRNNAAAVEPVAASIRDFGFRVPIVLDKNGVIVAGHTRLEAAKRLGLSKVPCVVADDLTAEQARAFRIADNKTAELATWDAAKLAEELSDISDFDMREFGFDGFQDEEPKETQEDDFDEEPPADPKAKRGDIYLLGNHRLMCGDSTLGGDVSLLMGEAKADLLFTDPPYNVSFNGRSGKFDVIKNDNLSTSEFQIFISKFLESVKLLAPKAYYICCNWAFYGVLQQELNPKACIVWAKNTFGMGNGYRHQHEFILFNGFIHPNIKNESDLWEIKKDVKYQHPTQKPIALSARAIRNSTTENQVVVDLFGGSGSTLLACEQLGRKCYTMELDPRYVDVIISRWEKFTGRKALKY